MSAVLSQQPMTQEQFFNWDGHQHGRYEFDGFQPVAMTGGSLDHSRIVRNIQATLSLRMRGKSCEPLGPDAGVQTVGKAVRYPDALITCTRTPGDGYLVAEAVVVFEVLSPTSGYRDRIVKLREYGAVPSIRRYVIVEREGVGFTVHERQGADDPWMTTTLAAGEVLVIPEVGIDVPVDEFYQGTDIAMAATEAAKGG